jgi:hypothetical protein
MNCVAMIRAVTVPSTPTTVLREFSREVKSLRINPLDIAWRIDVFGQRREHDYADRRSDKDTDTERPE